MNSFNSMKHALKKVRVENSDIKLKPVDAVARRVVYPKPWWAEPIPIPEAPKVTSEELQEEVKNLKASLSECRKQMACKDTKIIALKKEIAHKDELIKKKEVTILELSSYVKKLLS